MHFTTSLRSFTWLLYACKPVWSATLPSSDVVFSQSHLPLERLSPDEVQAMKKDQAYPSGQILSYATLPVDPTSKNNATQLVPVIQGDPDILLDNEQGVQARSLFARAGPSCVVWGRISGSCAITYCWTANDGTINTAHITITGSNGRSNPSSVSSSNTNIMGNWEYTGGWGQWFNSGHECSNGNTELVTLHRLGGGGGLLLGATAMRATVDHLQCDNCIFTNLECEGNLVNNLIAFTNGFSSGPTCRGNPDDEL